MDLHYDIVIIGGGPAGISASVSASRLGANVLLIEKDGVLGGMSGAGMLNVWCGNAYSKIFEKVIKNTTKLMPSGRRIFAPEKVKTEYINLIEKYGVNVLLHSFVSEVNVSGGKIESVKIATKSGYITVFGKIFIDCTGDGDIATMAGIPFEMGRDDGLMQPMTVEFMIGGVDDDAIHKEARLDPILQAKMQECLSNGKVSRPVGAIILLEALEPNVAYCNMTNVINVDGTNVFDLTKAELEARKQIPQIINFLRENVKGYSKCVALSSSSYAGVRETRRLKGKYTITANDIQNGKKFDDYLVDGANFCFDVHNPNGKVEDIESQPIETGNNYTIPYGCFVSENISNLAFAGRCISGDHYAHSNYRVMPICFAMGEGVGAMAYYSLKNSLNINNLSLEHIKQIQLLLKEDF